MSQELITDLMRFEGFRLFSVPASFGQDGRADPVTLGQDLGVGYVVKGSVSSDATTVRVGAQLYNAQTGAVVWSETYDRRADARRAARGPGGARRQRRDGARPGVRGPQQRHGGAPGGRRRAEHGELCLRAPRPHLPAHLPRRAQATRPRLPRGGGRARSRTMPSPGRCSAGCISTPARYAFVPDADAPAELGKALAMRVEGGRDRSAERGRAAGARRPMQYHLGNFAESERIQRKALALNPERPRRHGAARLAAGGARPLGRGHPLSRARDRPDHQIRPAGTMT